MARSSQPGFVYILYSIPWKRYKIGCSRVPLQRIVSLDFGAYPIRLIHIIQTDDKYGTEKALHQKYAGYREGRTEWFMLNAEMVADIIIQDSSKNKESILKCINDAVDAKKHSYDISLDDSSGELTLRKISDYHKIQILKNEVKVELTRACKAIGDFIKETEYRENEATAQAIIISHISSSDKDISEEV